MKSLSLHKLLRVIAVFQRETIVDFGVPQLAIFLQLCIKPGLTMPEIEEILNIPQTGVSRNIKKLSKYTEAGYKGVKGYDLVYTRPDLYERRRLAVFLTDKGERLKKEILEIMEEELDIGSRS